MRTGTEPGVAAGPFLARAAPDRRPIPAATPPRYAGRMSESTPAPVVYSAANPAPQSPEELAAKQTWGGAILDAAPGRTINVAVNRAAFIGMVCGVLSIFFNLFFLVAPVAVVFSILGLVRARELKAQAAPSTLMVPALIGLISGAAVMVVSLVVFVSFFVSSFGLTVN